MASNSTSSKNELKLLKWMQEHKITVSVPGPMGIGFVDVSLEEFVERAVYNMNGPE